MTGARYAALFVALATLAACSSERGALPAVSQRIAAAAATFVIAVPPKTTATMRRPLYISPNTQSVTISVSGEPAVTANLTASSPGCSAANGTLSCSIPVVAPVGNDTFAISLFAGLNGSGSALSSGEAQAAIVAGAANTVPVTLSGIVASVSVALGVSQPSVGTAGSIPLIVVAKDASGATIVGPAGYSVPIVLTDNDASGATSLSATTLNGPSSSVSLSYDGAAMGSAATIGASASGVPPSAVTGATVVAALPATSAAGVGVFDASDGDAYAFVPSTTGLAQVQLTSPFASTQIPLPSSVDGCAVDQPDALLYCYAFHSASVTVLSLKSLPSPAAVLTTIQTDASTYSLTSTNGCLICGILYDPMRHAVILSTALGFELYSTATAASPNAQLATIRTDASEVFGYYASSGTIVSPDYQQNFGWPAISQSIDLVSGGLTQSYRVSPSPPGLSAPDSAAVDAQTGVAIVPEELASSTGANTVYLLNVSSAQLNLPAAGQATIPEVTQQIQSSLFGTNAATQCGAPLTNAAIDPAAHLAFFSAEYCGQQSSDIYQSGNGSTTPIGVAVLPATSGSALQFGDYAFANMPTLPDGSHWDDAIDPHAASTFVLPGTCSDCGIVYNLEETWIAVVDLKKLLAAPRAISDVHLVNPAYDLVANGVVRYVATGAAANVPQARSRSAR